MYLLGHDPPDDSNDDSESLSSLSREEEEQDEIHTLHRITNIEWSIETDEGDGFVIHGEQDKETGRFHLDIIHMEDREEEYITS